MIVDVAYSLVVVGDVVLGGRGDGGGDAEGGADGEGGGACEVEAEDAALVPRLALGGGFHDIVLLLLFLECRMWCRRCSIQTCTLSAVGSETIGKPRWLCVVIDTGSLGSGFCLLPQYHYMQQ